MEEDSTASAATSLEVTADAHEMLRRQQWEVAVAGAATVLGRFGSLDVCEKESAEPRNIRMSER